MAAGHPPSLGRIAYEPIPDIDRFDHIIVDEAQDVSPIEWNVLDQYLARDGQRTLVGDINQRRSDTTYGSWQEIADHLVLGDGDSAFDIQPMRRGYRSRTRSCASQTSYCRPASVAANRSRPTGRLSSLRRCAQPDSSCRRSSNWPVGSPQSTARGRLPSSRWIQVPSGGTRQAWLAEVGTRSDHLVEGRTSGSPLPP